VRNPKSSPRGFNSSQNGAKVEHVGKTKRRQQQSKKKTAFFLRVGNPSKIGKPSSLPDLDREEKETSVSCVFGEL